MGCERLSILVSSRMSPGSHSNLTEVCSEKGTSIGGANAIKSETGKKQLKKSTLLLFPKNKSVYILHIQVLPYTFFLPAYCSYGREYFTDMQQLNKLRNGALLSSLWKKLLCFKYIVGKYRPMNTYLSWQTSTYLYHSTDKFISRNNHIPAKSSIATGCSSLIFFYT